MPKNPTRNQARFRIGDALVQPDRLVVALDGEEHAIEPKIMEVLIALAEAAQQGEVLSAEQLLIKVWRGTFYGDNPVHKAITCLRKVFTDDARSPRYIETIRKRGYRLVARVSYPDDYRRVAMHSEDWHDGSPYVGLNAFDAGHAAVFFGRSRTTAELLTAMRRQIDQQRRLVLVVGASGCGKTSLLNAGAIPLLTQDNGFDGLHALSVARCDLAGTAGSDAVTRLCASLMQWTLGDRTVFPPQATEWLARDLMTAPGTIEATITEAFRRHPSRELADQPHAHLLLVIDHAEALVATQPVDDDGRVTIERILQHLCDAPRTCVILIVRGDFYLALAEAFPDLTERKSGDGHLDVLTPRAGEIAEIIRVPAARASLNFQRDPDTGIHLDDALRDAAIAHPDALPLLQHTLQMLYERRTGQDELGFDAYREIGGLEGALAHRAEQVFDALPEAIRGSLDQVLSRIVVMQPENDSVSARRVARAALDGKAIALAEAFVHARLFVAEDDDGPHYRVTHEALLRQWPRAVDWIRENRRLILARIRLQRAAARWVEEGRRDDHLLNPGAPLEEAMEVRARMTDALPGQTTGDEHDFVLRSLHQQRRRKNARKAAAIALAAMAMASTAMAFVALSMRNVAERQEAKSANLTTFIIGEFSERLDPTGNLALIESVSTNILRYCEAMPSRETTADNLVNCSRASRKLGEVMMERGFSTSAFALFIQSKRFSEGARRLAPSSTQVLLEAGQSAAWIGRLHHARGEPALALLAWRNYQAMTREMRAISPLDPRLMMEASFAAHNLATLERDLGLVDSALDDIQRSIALKTTATSLSPGNDEWQYELIVSTSLLAGLFESSGKLPDADRLYADLIRRLQQLLRAHPAARDWERQLTSLLQFDAMLSLDLGDTADARQRIEDAIVRLAKLAGTEPDNVSWRRLLAQANLFASDIERIDGNHPASARHLSDAISAISHPMLNSTSAKRTHASILLRSGLHDGNAVDAARVEQAIRTLSDLVARDGNDRHARQALADALVLRAERDLDLGDPDAAGRHARQAIDVLDAFGTNPRDVRIVALRLRAMTVAAAPSENDTQFASLSRTGYRHPALEVARQRLTYRIHAGGTSH